jgi:hypothetical protein
LVTLRTFKLVYTVADIGEEAIQAWNVRRIYVVSAPTIKSLSENPSSHAGLPSIVLLSIRKKGSGQAGVTTAREVQRDTSRGLMSSEFTEMV